MLDTLAQSGTAAAFNTTMVKGNGSDLSNSALICGRAEKKLITQHLCVQLAKIAEVKKDETMRRMIWNTYHCQKDIITSRGKAYTKYCKNKFCRVCLANRKATIIHDYYPELIHWENPHFVTLTIRSCPACKLQKWISEGMIKGLRIILERLKKRAQRGKSIAIKGIRSLECNFNPVRRTYNPHFHLIVPNKETAEILIEEWLKLWTAKHAGRQGQHMRPVTDMERDLIEIIKYGTKVFTEDNPNRERRGKKQQTTLYIKALYNILKALRPHRLFERFGFNKTKISREKSKAHIISKYEKWTYAKTKGDWMNTISGELLTQFAPSEKLLLQLLKVDDELY